MNAGLTISDAGLAGVMRAALPQQRWFAEKQVPLESVTVADRVDLDARMSLVLVDVAPAGRRYFVPVTVTDDDEGAFRDGGAGAGVTIGDAMRTGELPQRLLDDVRHGRTRVARHGTFRSHAAPGLRALEGSATGTIRRLSVEQSNTSVILDDAIMFKAYRRVHAGPQAELEIARFLDTVGYANTPAFLGSIEYEAPDAEPTALCMLQRFVRSRGDAWATTLAHLEAAGGTHDVAFLDAMRTLGRRTAELHRAFATPTGDPAFDPEPVTAADAAAWTQQAVSTAGRALNALEASVDRLDAGLHAAAHAILERRDVLRARCRITPDDLAGTMKTRYHGDFHLGQVLDTGGDFLIVDFEGEPGRDPATRRRKASPIRDVAGMLRSFDYAAVTAQRASGDTGALAEWRGRTVDAFLTGYRTTIGDCVSYPSDPARAQRLLECFTLEKACYELSYELANRPAWIGLPLAGIGALVG